MSLEALDLTYAAFAVRAGGRRTRQSEKVGTSQQPVPPALQRAQRGASVTSEAVPKDQAHALLDRFCKTVLNLIIAAYKVAYQIPGSNLFVRLAYA
jgi:hypothetical protein